MRIRRLVLVAAAVGALTCLAFTGPASAGDPGPSFNGAPLTVNKVVSGPVPAGTTFTVTVTCDMNMINDSVDPKSKSVTFNAAGVATSDNVIEFGTTGNCQITETVTGGAATTAYACTGVPYTTTEVGSDAVVYPDPCQAVTATGVSLIVSNQWQTATVTVTNTFVDPPPLVIPAAEVVVAPAFTG